MQMLQFSTLFHSHFSLSLSPFNRFATAVKENRCVHRTTKIRSTQMHHKWKSIQFSLTHIHKRARTHARVCPSAHGSLHHHQCTKTKTNPNPNQLQLSEDAANNKRERRQCQKHQNEIETAVYTVQHPIIESINLFLVCKFYCFCSFIGLWSHTYINRVDWFIFINFPSSLSLFKYLMKWARKVTNSEVNFNFKRLNELASDRISFRSWIRE